MTDAREQLILAAERLIGERGLGVRMRDIATAAGQRNNSAVQYHFGSFDGLIEAVVEYRMQMLDGRRLELLAEHTAGSARSESELRGLVEVLVLPMFELGARHGARHYARFMEQARAHRSVADEANLERRATIRIIVTRIVQALPDLSGDLRVRRVRAMVTVMFALLAGHERAVEAGLDADDVAAVEAVDLLVGVLTAPATRQTTVSG